MVHIFFKKEYSQDYPPVFIQGWIFHDANEFKTYLTTRVYAKICDLEGKEDIKELLQEVTSTGFMDDNLGVVLAVDPEFEPWKIGEALGACFLEDHFGVYFPWNTNRDARVPKASLPGPDLVGFVKTESGCRFVFGEVKTSWDKNVPPKVVYGRTGMTLQLEKLRDDSSIRNQLFRWLAFRARGSEWESQFKEAAGAYLNCNKDLFCMECWFEILHLP